MVESSTVNRKRSRPAIVSIRVESISVVVEHAAGQGAPVTIEDMFEVELDTASVARVRVAASPLFESVAWLAVVATGTRHPVLGDPGAAARFALRDPAISAVATMINAASAQRYIPDFLTPKPPRHEPNVQLSEQLDIVDQTPGEEVARQLACVWSPAQTPPPRLRDPDRIPRLVVNALLSFWKTALSDIWPAVERTLEEQIHDSGTQMARGGVEALFATLSPDVQWTGRTLVLRKPGHVQVSLRNQELVIIPSVLSAHPLLAQLDDPGDATIGVASPTHLLGQLPPGRRGSLLGQTRTAVLTALDVPGTTRILARDLGLSEATVSHHLHALSRSGLAMSSRQGRWVMYALTPLGRRVRCRVA